MNAMSDGHGIVPRLMAVIEDRKAHPSERSYTSQLFQDGVGRIVAKVLEEAAEAVEAAAHDGAAGQAALIHEAADLVYHLLVLLAQRDVPWRAVEAELARRFGVSGLDEKARRTP